MKEGIELKKSDYLIEGYKEPLKPVEGGFGYYGVLTYSKDGKLIQSHLDGKFYEAIRPHHIQKFGIKNVREYKDRFGFPYTTGLLNKVSRSNFQKARVKSMSENIEYVKHIHSIGKGFSRKGRYTGRKGLSLEKRNQRGNCPDQVKEKFITFRAELKRDPTALEFSKRFGHGVYGQMLNDHGSWSKFCKAVGTKSLSDIKRERLSKENLIKSLQRFYKREGRVPMRTDFVGKNGLYHPTYYYKFFRTINGARAAAGLPVVMPRFKDFTGREHLFVDTELNNQS